MSLLALCLMLTATLPQAATSQTTILPQYRQVAIMPLSSLGSTDEAVAAIERVLHGELEKLIGERLIDADELRTRYPEVNAQLSQCDELLDCYQEVFGAYGWGAFIVGNIAGLGDDRVINIKLIDVRTGKEVRRAAEKANGDERQLISRMRKAAVGVLAPELFVGSLKVSATQPGVQVLVDGKLVGTVPLASPTLALAAGRHAVEARGDGLVPFSSMVDIAYGETASLTILLPENSAFVGGDTPFRARWWPWTIAAAGAVAAGVGGVFNYLHYKAARDFEKDHNSPDDVKALRQEKQNWRTATYFYGAGGGLVGGVGVLFVVDLL